MKLVTRQMSVNDTLETSQEYENKKIYSNSHQLLNTLAIVLGLHSLLIVFLNSPKELGLCTFDSV